MHQRSYFCQCTQFHAGSKKEAQVFTRNSGTHSYIQACEGALQPCAPREMALGPGWKAVPESAVVLSQWQVGQVARNWRFNLRDLKLGKKIKKNFCFAYFLPHIDNYEIFLSFHRKNTLRKFLDSCLGIIFFFFFLISQCISSGRLKYLHMNQILFSSTHMQLPTEHPYTQRPHLAIEILLENGN